MTDFYADLATTARDLIAEFGRDVQYAPNGTVDLFLGESWRGQTPAAAVTVRAAIFDASARDIQTNPNIVFTKVAWVAAGTAGVAPTAQDQIIDDIHYRIMRAFEIKPGPTVLAYRLLLSAAVS